MLNSYILDTHTDAKHVNTRANAHKQTEFPKELTAPPHCEGNATSQHVFRQGKVVPRLLQGCKKLREFGGVPRPVTTPTRLGTKWNTDLQVR